MRTRKKFYVLLLILLVLPTFTTRTDRAAGEAVRVGMIPDAGATQVSVEKKQPLREWRGTPRTGGASRTE